MHVAIRVPDNHHGMARDSHHYPPTAWHLQASEVQPGTVEAMLLAYSYKLVRATLLAS
jgi:hypothetical protein